MENEDPTGFDARALRRISVSLALIFAASLAYNSFFTGSLWLDELSTFWVVRDSLADTWHRAIAFQGQSPLYYLLLWADLQIFGSSEISLRLISLVALILAGGTLFRLARRLFDDEVALLAVVFFFSSSCVLRALSARPYALALLFAVLSVDALSRWLRSSERRHLIEYVIFTALTYYSHYLFAPIVIFHGALVWWLAKDSTQGRTQRVRSFLGGLLAIGVLAAPGLVQLASLNSRRASLFYLEHTSLLEFVKVLLPVTLLLSIVVGVVVIWAFTRGMRFQRVQGEAGHICALLVGYVLPPLLFFLYSLVGHGSLFNDRYFAWYAIPLSLLLAMGIKRLHPARLRTLCVVVIVLFLSFAETQRRWQIEDWREASRALQSANAATPVLLASGLVEANDVRWYAEAEKKAYLTSPLGYYPMAGLTVLLPRQFDSVAAKAYLAEINSEVFKHASKVYLVYLTPLPQSLRAQLSVYAEARHLKRRVLLKGPVGVEVFE